MWIVSRCAPVMAKMCVARSTSVAVSGWLRRSLMSTPSASQTCDGMQARRLSADRMDAGGCDFDVLAIAEQPAEKPFRHGAAANISCTNEEDAFHNAEPARARLREGKIKPIQVNAARGLAQSQWHVQIVPDTMASPLKKLRYRLEWLALVLLAKIVPQFSRAQCCRTG